MINEGDDMACQAIGSSEERVRLLLGIGKPFDEDLLNYTVLFTSHKTTIR